VFFLNDNVAVSVNLKKDVKLNKPISTGQAILDLSKLHMYTMFYDVLQPKF